MFDSQFTQQTVQLDDLLINFRIGGNGPPLLLLHGYPQTHFMWHEVAPILASDFTIICPDLRGYGNSAKPHSTSDHSNYSKRVMAEDQVQLMAKLDYEKFSVVGHDRGGRVAHRMALDYPGHIRKIAILDIAPTLTMFEATNQSFATGYYHWFFLIQPDGFPEHMIGLDPDYYLSEKLKRWSGDDFIFKREAISEYKRCFRDPKTIHASCEDYRAAATIDLEHDRESADQRITQPLLALWGKQGFVERNFDVLACWREKANDVEGYTLDCGHFLAEEKPKEVCIALKRFFNK
jgi:haloacetate dehalogenase